MFPDRQPPNEVKQYPEEPVVNLAPKRQSSPLARIVLPLAILIVIGIVAALLMHHAPAKPKASSNAQQTANSSAAGSITHISSSTKRYNSNDMYLTFYYPDDWTVNDPGDGVLTVTSPILQLKTIGSATSNARIIMTIQNQQTSISRFAANSATAPIASQKLTYQSPTPDQRAQTYLTAINYAGGSQTIDAFYITGDNGYTAGQYVPQSDVIEDDPLVSLSFMACKANSCNTATAITTSAWSDQNLSKPLINMLQSLEID